MANAPIESEILGQERQFWQTMKNGDEDGAVALTRFPCIISGPQGVSRVNETTFRETMRSHDARQYKDVEIDDPQVELLNDDAALITYSTEINSMRMINVSTWVRDGDHWKCSFHSENPEQRQQKKAS